MRTLIPNDIANLSDKMAVVLASQIVRENRELFRDIDKNEKITKKKAWEIISRYAIKRCDSLKYSDAERYDYIDIYNYARIKHQKIKPTFLENLNALMSL